MDGTGSDLEGALERARAGDAGGFEVLFRTFGATVAGYVRSRGVEDPDGTANEVFLRAFRTLHTFRGDVDRFRAWLFTIAHHAAVDDARRRGRRAPQVPAEHAGDPVGGNVEDDVHFQLARDRVDQLLRGLSPDQREVIVLRVVADLSVEDTAAVVGKSYEAVKALQRRGLAALRRALQAEDSSEEAVPR